MTDSRLGENADGASCVVRASLADGAPCVEATSCTDALSRAEGDEGSLDVVPTVLPALEQALAISEIAVDQGFEWGSVEGVWAKVAEEIGEFKDAFDRADKELEFGDVLFSLVNIARWEGIDPEQALIATCRKFRWRWAHMEQAVRSQGRVLSDLTTEELLQSWKQAKQDEKKKGVNYVS